MVRPGSIKRATAVSEPPSSRPATSAPSILPTPPMMTMISAFMVKALIIVIMGGVGNMLGALVAGLLLGVSETAVARLIDPGLTIAVTYALFLSVLLWRPTGLFGRPGR